ncbi:MAG TPA: hypothetical protein VJ875_03015 [Pyrinomonadaceae bacterium]|nr:hypothetical protein [Pyrinomonadaceae bacterium]
MARIVVAIRPSSTNGKSSLTRYIAESKRNPEKEGLRPDEPRPLFSAHHDNLTYTEADQFLQLATDTEAQTEDLIHLCISPEPGLYEEIGDTREERYDAFMQILRDTGQVIEKEVGFVEVFWISGIHLNTDIPHAHLAISRHGCDRISQRHKYLDHLPRTLLPKNVKDDNGQKQFVPGKIADAVSEGIEQRRQLIRERNDKSLSQSQELDRSKKPPAVNIEVQLDPTTSLVTSEAHQSTQPIDAQRNQVHTNPWANEPSETHLKSEPSFQRVEDIKNPPPHASKTLWRDRYLLGRSMVARAEVDRLQEEVENLREHGDKRRFRVYDASRGRTRPISEFDIRRRADASASAVTRQLQIAHQDQRHEHRQAHYDSEIERHEKGIHDHRIVVSKTIDKVEGDLTAARKQHAELIPHVNRIRHQCQEYLPVPLLTPAELNKLQEQAIATRKTQRVNTLETIREALATERGEVSRSDKDVARLDGQLLVARSTQAASQERLDQFERRHHQTRFEINGEKYSLTDLDRRIGEQDHRARVFGSPLKITNLHLRPSSRRHAAAQAQELREIRAVVLERIEERRQELCAAVKESQLLTATLSEIHKKEHARLIERNGERQEKILTRKEIGQLVDHATLKLDPAMLQHALILETRFEERQPDSKQPSLKEQAARAIGREILTDIALKQATEKLHSFEENKIFTPVAVKDTQGHERTARLFDFRHSHHPVIWLMQRIFESKEHRHLRQETSKAINREHDQLKDEVATATKCKVVTSNFADFYRERMQSVEEPPSVPTFTPKQIIQLEIYAVRHNDPAERTRVETLIQRAEIASLDHQTLQTHKPQEPEPLSPAYALRRPEHHPSTEQTARPTNSSGHQALNRTENASPDSTHASLAQPHQSQQPQQQATPNQPIREDPDLDLIR